MIHQVIINDYLACFAQSLASFAVNLKLIILKILICAIIIIKPSQSLSQEIRLTEVIISIAEQLAESESDPEPATTYIEQLTELAENPVDLNSPSETELSRLFFLSDFQVKALADYSYSTGRIVSFNELAYIPGFDRATAEMMIPFCTLKGEKTTISDSVKLRSILITNLSFRSGKSDTSSLGSPLKILTRYKFSAGKFTGGFTLEKDQGEKFFSPGTKSPDFYSANIAYNGSGIIRRVILGDFAARFGQGTNINTGISTGLSLTSQGYMAANDEIKPYTSTDENNYFRGIATWISIKNLDVSLFCSENKIDATPGISSGSSEDYIENLYKSGSHNTSTLLLKKDAITESACGMNISCNFSNLKIGMTLSENRFSLPIIPENNDPEKLFSFRGEINRVSSLYYNTLIKRILLYGEFSANDLKKYAIIQGVSFRPSDRLSINFLFRNYTPGYISFHGKGPGRSSGKYCEQGILGNFTFEAARHLFISGGCDIEKFPWLKYRCSSPSRGVKREIRIKYLPSERLTLDGLYSYRFSMADSTTLNRIPELKQVFARSLKLSVHYSLNEYLTLGTRFDYKIVDPAGSKGVAMMEDIGYRSGIIPLSIWLRYCIFSTADYDSRIYTWENDLLYSFNIPALYGRGSRFYLMAGWKISGKAEIRFKYGILSRGAESGSITDTEEFRLQLKLII